MNHFYFFFNFNSNSNCKKTYSDENICVGKPHVGNYHVRNQILEEIAAAGTIEICCKLINKVQNAEEIYLRISLSFKLSKG